jgi:hypothetical protein
MYFLVLFVTLFYISCGITHMWTSIIAFQESGFFALILTLVTPLLSELYWMFAMFGENDTYAYLVLVQFILAIPVGILASNK